MVPTAILAALEHLHGGRRGSCPAAYIHGRRFRFSPSQHVSFTKTRICLLYYAATNLWHVPNGNSSYVRHLHSIMRIRFTGVWRAAYDTKSALRMTSNHGRHTYTLDLLLIDAWRSRLSLLVSSSSICLSILWHRAIHQSNEESAISDVSKDASSAQSLSLPNDLSNQRFQGRQDGIHETHHRHECYAL